MKYMTTNQAAEKWGISPRRVRSWCQRGEVEGAFCNSNGWNIPQTATKPLDGRTKEKRNSKEPVDRIYLYFNTYYYDNRDTLTDEKEIRLGEILDTFLRGEIKQARKMLFDFISSCDDKDYLIPAYILYMLILTDCGENYESYYNKFFELVETGNYPYTKLLFQIYFNQSNIDFTTVDIPKNMQSLFLYFGSRTVLTQMALEKKEITREDMRIFELNCKILDGYNSPCLSAYFHTSLAVVYTMLGDEEYCQYHKNKVAKICLERKWYSIMAAYSFTVDWSFIRDIDESAYEKIDALAETIVNSLIRLGTFSEIFTNYKIHDIQTIKVAFLMGKGKTNNEMAKILNTSLYNIKKRVNEVYETTGLNSREEIGNLIRNQVSLI